MADDFIKTIEQARMLMKMFNSGAATAPPNPAPVRAASEPAQAADFHANPETPVPDADLKILSAAIPFVPGRNKKNLFFALKLMEILRFNERYGGSVTIAEKEEKPFRPEELVSAVSPYITASERDRLNILIKAAEIDKLMSALKESANNG